MILIFVAGLIAMLLTLILGVPYLDFLKKKMLRQYIREDVASMHAQKAGTPTMGGLLIVGTAVVASILSLFMESAFSTILVLSLITIILYCYTGYQDDIKKIHKKQNEGLSARGKLILQIAVALLPALYMAFVIHTTDINLFNVWKVNIGWLYPLFTIFVIIGSSNAVNLTDGLDGLAGGCSFLAFSTLAALCQINGYTGLAIVSAAIAGSCLGFLYFNKFPAKIFMGDTGSLALGGALGMIAILSKNEFWLLFIGIIFIIETLSVIIQVTSFKTTGKRVFKMSPIHHHFELCGWKEQKIVYTFWGITLIFCLLALMIRLFVV
ncbi:MAG: phospho-N-acetylmuramoyl-pentapeptide-transferase [Candidatus Gastranaerophilales bacterium]|nr:phospho-N-acetylmuramoyl-pentapeptide-transferase [Candidatus Gastranaerophilales bacterium]